MYETPLERHHSGHMPSLQALRALAALLVVCYHTESQFAGTVWDGLYETFFYRGHIGVDLFFVLSGFLMVYLRPRNAGYGTALRFIARRLLRVWPSYVLATALWAGLVYYESSAQIIQSLLFLPIGTDPPLVLGFPVLYVGWTLNYEVYFYLLCGVLLLANSRRFMALLLLWAALTLVLLPLLYGQNLATPPLKVPAEKYPFLYMALITNPIIWEFVMGGLVAVLARKFYTRIKALPLAWVRALALFSIGMFTVSLVVLDNKMEPLACGLPAAVLLAALVMADIRGAWGVPDWLQGLGDASYCTYLLHPLWIVCFTPLLKTSPLVEAGGVVLVIAATLGSAFLMHRFFERPILLGGRYLLAPQAVIAPGTGRERRL